jgi:hypothetical protein
MPVVENVDVFGSLLPEGTLEHRVIPLRAFELDALLGLMSSDAQQFEAGGSGDRVGLELSKSPPATNIH